MAAAYYNILHGKPEEKVCSKHNPLLQWQRRLCHRVMIQINATQGAALVSSISCYINAVLYSKLSVCEEYGRVCYFANRLRRCHTPSCFFAIKLCWTDPPSTEQISKPQAKRRVCERNPSQNICTKAIPLLIRPPATLPKAKVKGKIDKISALNCFPCDLMPLEARGGIIDVLIHPMASALLIRKNPLWKPTFSLFSLIKCFALVFLRWKSFLQGEGGGALCGKKECASFPGGVYR